MVATVFMNTATTRDAIKKMLSTSGDASVAVAYWGKGAVQSLGLARRRGATRVICDLYSGGCNPAEIDVLRRLKQVQVRTKDRLHAKVYILPPKTVVGSSNASIGGLDLEEGAGAQSNFEASALIHDQVCAAQAQQWFDDLWDASDEIEDDDLREAMAAWKSRPHGKRMLTQTLLQALEKNPDRFATIRITAYFDTPVSEKAKQAFEEQGRPLYKGLKSGQLPYYEIDTDWDLGPGDIVLDYNGHTKRLAFDGCWQVREDHPFIELGKNHRLILLNRLDHVRGCRFPGREQKLVGEHVKRAAAQNGWKPDRHGNLLDVRLVDFWRHSALRKPPILTFNGPALSQAEARSKFERICEAAGHDHVSSFTLSRVENKDASRSDYWGAGRAPDVETARSRGYLAGYWMLSERGQRFFASGIPIDGGYLQPDRAVIRAFLRSGYLRLERRASQLLFTAKGKAIAKAVLKQAGFR